MTTPNLERDDLQALVLSSILASEFRRATFAGTTRWQSTPWVRIVIRPVRLRGQRLLQFSHFDGRKTRVINHTLEQARTPLVDLFALGFAGIHVATTTEELNVRITKKGKIQIGKSVPSPTIEDTAHNRVKDLPLPEGRANRLLEVMGVLTREGRVRPTMRAKFTQVNEFLKHLLHVLDESGLRNLGRPIEILDCGCGASYLTLAAHHYLNEVLNLSANVVGVDVNEEVIQKSIDRAARLDASGLTFVRGKIGTLACRADLVIALHACDTATDDALAQAIRSEARLVLCVPCCHHDLNPSIRAQGSASVLRPILRHGILQQRTADLVTDAFRALVLRIMGYRTDVVEFVSPEHTARNLMIRAVRGSHPVDQSAVAEFLEMKRFWGVTPYLEKVLGDAFSGRLLTSKKDE